MVAGPQEQPAEAFFKRRVACSLQASQDGSPLFLIIAAF
jgi:hypothetical protein